MACLLLAIYVLTALLLACLLPYVLCLGVVLLIEQKKRLVVHCTSAIKRQR